MIETEFNLEKQYDSQFSKKRSRQVIILTIVGILIVFILPPGCFLYNIHCDCADFVKRRTEVTQSIELIATYNNEYGHWPEELDEEIEIVLPSGWQYHFFADSDPFIQLTEGKKWLRYQFDEKKNGYWSFYLEGDRMKWSWFARPLPNDPK